MFLLLFFLLSTSSGQRLGVIDLRLAAPGEAPPLPHAGVVKAIRISVATDGARVEFEVASTDIAAAATTRELRAVDVPAAKGNNGTITPDYGALAQALTTIKGIDRSQLRAEVLPAPNLPTEILLPVLDLARGPADSPLFPRLSLQ